MAKRNDRESGVFEKGATQPVGIDRLSNGAKTFTTGC